jgi:hypothetical protein
MRLHGCACVHQLTTSLIGGVADWGICDLDLGQGLLDLHRMSHGGHFAILVTIFGNWSQQCCGEWGWGCSTNDNTGLGWCCTCPQLPSRLLVVVSTWQNNNGGVGPYALSSQSSACGARDLVVLKSSFAPSWRWFWRGCWWLFPSAHVVSFLEVSFCTSPSYHAEYCRWKSNLLGEWQ